MKEEPDAVFALLVFAFTITTTLERSPKLLSSVPSEEKWPVEVGGDWHVLEPMPLDMVLLEEDDDEEYEEETVEYCDKEAGGDSE